MMSVGEARSEGAPMFGDGDAREGTEGSAVPSTTVHDGAPDGKHHTTPQLTTLGSQAQADNGKPSRPRDLAKH